VELPAARGKRRGEEEEGGGVNLHGGGRESAELADCVMRLLLSAIVTARGGEGALDF
jgi:hypothetical protein